MLCAGLVVVAGLALGCGSTRGRIMGDEEQDLVGNRKAGAPTYDRLVEGAVQKMLGLHRAEVEPEGPMKVAFMGVENKGIEEMVDAKAQMEELISTSINRSGVYRTISERFVRRALREIRGGRDDLLLPEYRRRFLAVLEKQRMPVHCLLFATLTTLSTGGQDEMRQRNYMLTLEMIDVESGWNDKVSTRIRKEYNR
jgi:hypothetical protein